MSLITRITRLFKADMHAVLDCLEEPEMILKQSVREMQAIIGQGEARLKCLEHHQDGLNRQAARLRREGDAIGQHIDLCFAESNDNLARASVRKKLETDQLVQAVADQQRALTDRHAALCSHIEAQKQQLQNVLDQLDWVSEEQRHDRGGAYDERPESTSSRGAVSDDAVELAWLQEKRRRVQKTDGATPTPDA